MGVAIMWDHSEYYGKNPSLEEYIRRQQNDQSKRDERLGIPSNYLPGHYRLQQINALKRIADALEKLVEQGVADSLEKLVEQGEK